MTHCRVGILRMLTDLVKRIHPSRPEHSAYRPAPGLARARPSSRGITSYTGEMAVWMQGCALACGRGDHSCLEHVVETVVTDIDIAGATQTQQRRLEREVVVMRDAVA